MPITQKQHNNLQVIELSGKHRTRLSHCPKYRKYDSQYMFCGSKRIVIVQRNQRDEMATHDFTAKILHKYAHTDQSTAHFDHLVDAMKWAERMATK